MQMNRVVSVLLTVFLSLFSGGDTGWAETPAAPSQTPGVQEEAAVPTPEAVNVPLILHGHAVDSGKGNGRSYYYIVLAEQIREVYGVEITFTREGPHWGWMVYQDGSIQELDSEPCGKGTYQLPVPKGVVRLEFDLFTDEVPNLGLKAAGGMTVLNTPYAGRSLAILSDSLSEADDWKTEGEDPNAYRIPSQWWYAAAKEFGMNLLVNNSVGSTGVYQESGPGRQDSGLYRCTALHTAAREPDEIFVLLGANDILNRRSAQEVREGYSRMVQTMQERYPKAHIVLFTYPYFGSVDTLEEYRPKVDGLNAAIRAVAEERGVPLVDLSACPFTADNIGQYLRDPGDIHYNRAGQERIGTEAVKGLYRLAAEQAAK